MRAASANSPPPTTPHPTPLQDALAVSALIAAPNNVLHTLALENCKWSGVAAADFARVLSSRAAGLANLKHLKITATDIGVLDHSLETVIAALPHLPRLRSLHIHTNAFLSSPLPPLTSLRFLDLRLRFERDGLLLLPHLHLSPLHTLALMCFTFGPKPVPWLTAQLPPSLLSLRLCNGGLDDDTVCSLATTLKTTLPRLIRLGASSQLECVNVCVLAV